MVGKLPEPQNSIHADQLDPRHYFFRIFLDSQVVVAKDNGMNLSRPQDSLMPAQLISYSGTKGPKSEELVRPHPPQIEGQSPVHW